ncbi:hypothetical protein ACJQWK_01254 [Exserohilum turcicum]
MPPPYNVQPNPYVLKRCFLNVKREPVTVPQFGYGRPICTALLLLHVPVFALVSGPFVALLVLVFHLTHLPVHYHPDSTPLPNSPYFCGSLNPALPFALWLLPRLL